MKGQERIREAFERNAKALSLRPSIGQGTAVARVRVVEGATCEITDGAWSFTADMGEKSGGEGRGPDPGVFGRTALGSCLAINYVMWAARLGFPLEGLEVEIQADYDARGYHGLDDVTPGYEEIRYLVRVESDAPEQEVLAFLDEADSHCDFLHVFRDPQPVRREVEVVAPAPATEEVS